MFSECIPHRPDDRQRSGYEEPRATPDRPTSGVGRESDPVLSRSVMSSRRNRHDRNADPRGSGDQEVAGTTRTRQFGYVDGIGIRSAMSSVPKPAARVGLVPLADRRLRARVVHPRRLSRSHGIIDRVAGLRLLDVFLFDFSAYQFAWGSLASTPDHKSWISSVWCCCRHATKHRTT